MASLFDEEPKKAPSLFDDDQPKRTAGTNWNDASIAFTKGLVGLGQGVVGLGDIVSGGQVGKAVKDSGIDLQAIQDFASKSYSPAQRQANKAVEDSQGFVGGLKAVAENPSYLATTFLESAPSMFGGGIAGKAAQKALPVLGKVQAGAVGEGIMGAGSAAENIRQEDAQGTLGIGQTAAALGTGLVNTVAGQYGSKIAGKLGAKDVDSVLAGTSSDVLSPKNLTVGQAARGVAGGAISEGGEELVQSANEQLLQNLALGKDAADGVSKAAALGLASGGSMGGALNAANAGAVLASQQARPDTKESAVVQDAVNAEQQFLDQKDPNGDPFISGVTSQPAPDVKVIEDQAGNQNVVSKDSGFASKAVFASGENISSQNSAIRSASEQAAQATVDQANATGQSFLTKADEQKLQGGSVSQADALGQQNEAEQNIFGDPQPASTPVTPADPVAASNAQAIQDFTNKNDQVDLIQLARDTATQRTESMIRSEQLAAELDAMGIPREQHKDFLSSTNPQIQAQADKVIEKVQSTPLTEAQIAEIGTKRIASNAATGVVNSAQESVGYTPQEKQAANKEMGIAIKSGDQATLSSTFAKHQNLWSSTQVTKFKDQMVKSGDNQGLALVSQRMTEAQTIGTMRELAKSGNVEAFRAVASSSLSIPKQESQGFADIAKAVQASGNPDLASIFSEFQARAVEDQQLKAARNQIASGLNMSTVDSQSTLAEIQAAQASGEAALSKSKEAIATATAQTVPDGQKSGETPEKKSIRLKLKAQRILNSKVGGLGDAFVNSPKVKFITSKEAEKIAGTDGAKAYFNSTDGSVTFIADRIASEVSDNKLFGIILHEAGVHGGKLGRDEPEFKKILATLETMSKSGNKFAKAAFDRVPKNTPESLVSEEAMGYFAEQNPEHALTKTFVEYLRMAVRRLVKTLGLSQDKAIVKWANSMSDAELVNAAMEGLQAYIEAQAQQSKVDSTVTSKADESVSQPVNDAILQSSADDHVGDKATPEQKNKATLANVGKIAQSWKGFKESWAEFTDKTTIELIDKFADLKPLVASAKDLRDALNPILAISAMHGRRDEMHTRANLEVAAIAKFIKSKGIDSNDLGKYMVALFVHKDDANKKHMKWNKELKNAASSTGVSDEEAAQIVAKASPDMVEAGKMFRKLIDGNLKLAFDSGIISKVQYEKLTKNFPNYVTLPKNQDSKSGSGKGVSVTGKLSYEEGSFTGDVTKLLELSAQERAKIIDMAEKNRVASVLAAFVGTYMKPDDAGEEPKVRLDRDNKPTQFDSDTGYMLMSDGGTSTFTPPKIKRGSDGKEVNDPSYAGRDNVITYMIDGEKHHIIFNEKDEKMVRLARNLKNMDDAEIGGILGFIGKITRWISSVNTQYNPAFGPFNFLRDLFYSGITASAMGLDGVKIMTNAAKNLGGIMAAEFNLAIDGKVDESNDFRKRYAAAKSKGMTVGFSELVRNNEERAKAIEKSLESGLQWELNAKSISSIGRLISGSMKAWNTAFENSTRMAAYEQSLDKMSADVKSGKITAADAEARAVYNAKNITVDFNRKGASSSVAGALYGFFNSSVQGSVRLKEVLTKEGSWKLSKTGWKVASIAVGVGVLQALALSAMGFGPNEPDEETMTKFIIIPYISSTGEKKTLKIPMPLGLNIFPSTVRNIVQGIIHGDMGSRVGSMFTTVASSFNPIGSSGSLIQIAAPTFMDLPIQLATNEDGFERQIARTDRSNREKTPGYTRHKDSTSSEAIALSKFINDMTGGTARVPGAWSPTPDQLEYSLSYIFGGVGRTASDLKTLAVGDKNGERGIKNVPVLKRFVGNESSPDKEFQKFFQYTNKLNEHERILKNAREDGVDQAEYRAKNPETKLISVANIAEKQTKLLAEARRKAKEKGADQEKLREFDEKMTDLRSKFNRKFEELRDSKTQ